MTNNPGYVYVLVNPATEGLVKIGKTTRNPEDRAKELSSATGVSTPFILVYSSYFNDCDEAETFIHTLLKDKRLSSNKEFFRISSTEAIKAVIKAENVFFEESSKSQEKIIADQSKEKSIAHEEDCATLLDTAEKHLHGYSDFLKDEDLALKLYSDAINLGCIEAYYHLGEYYYHEKYIWSDNIKDLKQALKYYREGAERNDHKCWGNVAVCYQDLEDYSNSDKCWVKLFKNPSWEELDSIEAGQNIYHFIKYMNSDGRHNYQDLLSKTEQVLAKHSKPIYSPTTEDGKLKDYEFLELLYQKLIKQNPDMENW